MAKKNKQLNSDNKLPNKLKCVKCGKMCGVREDILKARIVKHGTLERLQAEYFCRSCRKKHTYVVNNEPVTKNTTPGYTSPLMKQVLNGEMWWQQDGYKFPGTDGSIGRVISPYYMFKRDVNGNLVKCLADNQEPDKARLKRDNTDSQK